MPLFKIQLRTAARVWDTLTINRDDHTQVRVELASFVGEMLKDHANQIWQDQDWRVDVTDEAGLILYAMQIWATDSPATMHFNR
jgi:hypothetical protein